MPKKLPQAKRQRLHDLPVLSDELIVGVLELVHDAQTMLRFGATSHAWRVECSRDKYWHRIIVASIERYNRGLTERPSQFVCDAMLQRVFDGFRHIAQFFRAHYKEDCSFELVGEHARAFWRGRPDLIPPPPFHVIASNEYFCARDEAQAEYPHFVMRPAKGDGIAHREEELPEDQECELLLYNAWSARWDIVRMTVLRWRRRGSFEPLAETVLDPRQSLLARIWDIGTQEWRGCDPPPPAVNSPLPVSPLRRLSRAHE